MSNFRSRFDCDVFDINYKHCLLMLRQLVCASPQWDLSPDPDFFLFVCFANLLFQETNAVKDANDFVLVSNFRCTFDCDVFDIDHKHCFVVVPTSACAFAFPSCGIVKQVKLIITRIVITNATDFAVNEHLLQLDLSIFADTSFLHILVTTPTTVHLLWLPNSRSTFFWGVFSTVFSPLCERKLCWHYSILFYLILSQNVVLFFLLFACRINKNRDKLFKR